MKQTFEEADKNGDGLLNIEEIYQLLHKLNVNLPRRKVKQMFQVSLKIIVWYPYVRVYLTCSICSYTRFGGLII